MASMAKAWAPRRSPIGRPARPPRKAKGIRMPAASQVGAGMRIVAAWEASVTAYESAKNARSVARTVLAAAPASSS